MPFASRACGEQRAWGFGDVIASLKANYKAGKGQFFFKRLPLLRMLGLQVSHLVIPRGDIRGQGGPASLCKQLARAPARHLLRGICSACFSLPQWGHGQILKCSQKPEETVGTLDSVTCAASFAFNGLVCTTEGHVRRGLLAPNPPCFSQRCRGSQAGWRVVRAGYISRY